MWFDWNNRLFIDGEFIRICTDWEILIIGLQFGWYKKGRDLIPNII
jgi:hypothetical protein